MAKSPSLYSINPFTKRKTKKCSPSHERYVNPQKKTFRCLVKCKKGQTRNPKTRRCNYTKNEKKIRRNKNKKSGKQKKSLPKSYSKSLDFENIYKPKKSVDSYNKTDYIIGFR